MSIATEITRLQGIKTDIRTALVTQGIAQASSHNMADFSADILAIQGGSEGVYITVMCDSAYQGYDIILSANELEIDRKQCPSSLEVNFFVSADDVTLPATFSISNSLNSMTTNFETIMYGWYETVLYDMLAFYNLGKEYTYITGGWTSWSTSSSTATKNSDNLYFSSKSSTYIGGFRTVNKINFDNINKLIVTYKKSGSSNGVIGITDLTTPKQNTAIVDLMIKSYSNLNNEVQTTIEINVSTWKGSHYLALGARNSTCTVYSIKYQ